jgi:hypothetical protein
LPITVGIEDLSCILFPDSLLAFFSELIVDFQDIFINEGIILVKEVVDSSLFQPKYLVWNIVFAPFFL